MKIFSQLLSILLVILFAVTSYASYKSEQSNADMTAENWAAAKQELTDAIALLPIAQFSSPDLAPEKQNNNAGPA